MRHMRKNKGIFGILVGAIITMQMTASVFAKENLNAAIDIPGSYVCQDTHISVMIPEQEGLTIKSIKYKIEGSEYKDITSSKYFTVDDNCTVYVKILYSDLQTEEGCAELCAEITNFDGVKPEVTASIKGEILTIMASDDLSGVASIHVNDKEYTQLSEGSLCINIKELETTQSSITIRAKDAAGNDSPTYKIKNPYYVGETQTGMSDRSTDNPGSTDATQKTEATATVVDYEGGDGGKEFYTIRTDSDKTFYLVVDKNDVMENVYLLTEVGENDLLNFVNYDGNTIHNGDVPVYTIMEDGEKNEEQTEGDVQEESKNTSYLIYGVAALIVAGFYMAKEKKKKRISQESDMENGTGDEPL